jgi:hypothetical protein
MIDGRDGPKNSLPHDFEERPSKNNRRPKNQNPDPKGSNPKGQMSFEVLAF